MKCDRRPVIIYFMKEKFKERLRNTFSTVFFIFNITKLEVYNLKENSI